MLGTFDHPVATYCDILACRRLKFDQFQTWANDTQHVAAGRNSVVKRTQHVATILRYIGLKCCDQVSVKCGLGAGVKRLFFLIVSLSFISFFLFFFFSSSDFSQFSSAEHRYNIFRYKEDEMRLHELIFSRHPKQSRHMSVKRFENRKCICFFKSSSTALISAIEVHK